MGITFHPWDWTAPKEERYHRFATEMREDIMGAYLWNVSTGKRGELVICKEIIVWTPAFVVFDVYWRPHPVIVFGSQLITPTSRLRSFTEVLRIATEFYAEKITSGEWIGPHRNWC